MGDPSLVSGFAIGPQGSCRNMTDYGRNVNPTLQNAVGKLGVASRENHNRINWTDPGKRRVLTFVPDGAETAKMTTAFT